MRTAAIALLALLGTGCLGPGYQTPPLALPRQWEEKPAGVQIGQPPAARWWSTFGDPILEELIDAAISGNLDLRAAAARVREARAQRGITAARGKPQVDAVALAADTNGDALFDAGFDAAWELDFFGGVRRDVEAAIAQVEAVEESSRDVEITLVAEVARNYVELRGAQTRLDVLDARIGTLRDTLEIVQARRDGGLANDLDVARSEGLLEDTAAARPALEFSVVSAVRRLAVLAGRQPGALRERLAAHAPIPAIRIDPAIGAPGQLIAQRADVRRAERELAAATARIDVARADLYPRIALFGALGHRSDDGRDFGGASSRYWAFGPSLRWPLLSGGRVRSQIEAKRARRDEAAAAYDQSVLRALEDVENALAGYGRTQRERERLAQAVAAERRAVDLASARYRAGLDNFLTVLDAQRTLRDGEDRLAVADTRIALSAIALYKSLGGSALDR